MDLVQEAGIDVAAWADFKGGVSRAATNPRYCYEWAFEKPGRFVVLNIWYRDIRPAGRRFILEANLRASAAKHGRNRDGASSLWQKRADRFDQAVALAASDGLPVRAVICDGIMRRATEGRASKVQKRDLDPVTWAVTFYDAATGAFTLTRGALQTRLVDQFNAGTAAGSPTGDAVSIRRCVRPATLVSGQRSWRARQRTVRVVPPAWLRNPGRGHVPWRHTT